MPNSLNRTWLFMAVFLSILSGCAATRTKDSTGQYIDDATITTKVKAALLADKDISTLHIHVKTTRGVVYLTGSADLSQEADKAAKDANGVAGVQSVDNDIQVR
ncbi:MAG: BON domain-containing protein [Acidiferrobacterales bacterium]